MTSAPFMQASFLLYAVELFKRLFGSSFNKRISVEGTISACTSFCTHATACSCAGGARRSAMIRKLKSGAYRLYSRKTNPKTGRRRNLGTFKTRAAAQKHERAVQYFKRSG